MFRRRAFSESDVTAAVKAAVADATNAASLATHMAQCELDKAAIREALKEQNADRVRMHAENSVRFAKIERMIYYATGAIGLLMTLYSTQAGDVMRKILH